MHQGYAAGGMGLCIRVMQQEEWGPIGQGLHVSHFKQGPM